MEESTGEGGLPLCPGFVHNLCKDAQVRRTFVLPQYWGNLLGYDIRDTTYELLIIGFRLSASTS